MTCPTPHWLWMLYYDMSTAPALAPAKLEMICVTHFCTLRKSKNLLPCENPTQRAKTCDKIWYLRPLPIAHIPLQTVGAFFVCFPIGHPNFIKDFWMRCALHCKQNFRSCYSPRLLKLICSYSTGVPVQSCAFDSSCGPFSYGKQSATIWLSCWWQSG